MSRTILKIAAKLVALLSWRQAQRLGAFLGLVWFNLVRIRRKTVFANLATAMPEHASKHFEIARNTYRHLGISALEFFKLARMTPLQISSRVHPHGMQHFEAASARGKGVIIVTAHFGNFDLLACSQAAKGIKLGIVSRDLHATGSNRFWMETRARSGLEIFPDERVARQILRWLKAGNALGLTVDQRTGPEREGILSEFMGADVWTTTAPAKLAIHTGATLLPVRIERRDDGNHDLLVEPPIATKTSTGDSSVASITAEMNRIVGNWVARKPDHWLWLHKRFTKMTKS
jgi:Kdo2-lipid IVA lauroyltransferase/acyltransferase